MDKKHIKNSKSIGIAIGKAAEEYGGQASFAELIGVNQNTISRYISGGIVKIPSHTWLLLYPYIEGFLPENSKNKATVIDEDKTINLIGYNHGTIVVHSIAGMTTAKEIKSDLTARILDCDDLDEKMKFKIINLINKE